MTAEQKDGLKKVAEAWRVVGNQFVDPTMRNAAAFITLALEEIDNLQADLEWLRKREIVLANGLRAAYQMWQRPYSYPIENETTVNVAMKLLDDSDGARLTPATGKGAA